MSTATDGVVRAETPSASDTALPFPTGTVLRPFPGVVVFTGEAPRVELAAEVAIDRGWLEQVACSPGTRDHEALLLVTVRPRDIHAALLLAGFEAGAPGRWTQADGDLALVPPRGSPLTLSVRRSVAPGAHAAADDPAGDPADDPMGREVPITAWIVSADGARPGSSWIFGGSAFDENPEWMGPGEHYVADLTGSIVGLVTFGDEVIGYRYVISDAADVHAPEWQADTAAIPAPGTAVTLVIRGLP